MKTGIYSSLRTIVEKRVLPSLSPLFDNPRLDKELRTMLKTTFRDFLSKEEEDRSEPGPIIDRDDNFSSAPDPGGPAFSDDEEEDDIKEEPVQIRTENNSLVTGKAAQNILDAAPTFGGGNSILETSVSDNSGGNKKLNRKQSNHVMMNGESEELDQDIVSRLEELRAETKVERRCDAMAQLIEACISSDVCGEAAHKVAEQLSEILRDQFEGKIFPSDPTPDNIEDSVGRPLFVIFRTLCEISENDHQR